MCVPPSDPYLFSAQQIFSNHKIQTCVRTEVFLFVRSAYQEIRASVKTLAWCLLIHTFRDVVRSNLKWIHIF